MASTVRTQRVRRNSIKRESREREKDEWSGLCLCGVGELEKKKGDEWMEKESRASAGCCYRCRRLESRGQEKA